MIKCECGNHADFYYNKKNLCACHYWVERGRPKTNSLIDGMLRDLRYLHPIRMKKSCAMDKCFSDYMASIPKKKTGGLNV